MSRYREFCPNCAFGGCVAAENLVITPEINAIKCPHFKGMFKYRSLPAGMRPAELKDFFEHERLRIGMKYLLHSWYANHYQTYTVSDRIDLESLKEFIKDKRCFVKLT